MRALFQQAITDNLIEVRVRRESMLKRKHIERYYKDAYAHVIQ